MSKIVRLNPNQKAVVDFRQGVAMVQAARCVVTLGYLRDIDSL